MDNKVKIALMAGLLAVAIIAFVFIFLSSNKGTDVANNPPTSGQPVNGQPAGGTAQTPGLNTPGDPRTGTVQTAALTLKPPPPPKSYQPGATQSGGYADPFIGFTPDKKDPIPPKPKNIIMSTLSQRLH